MVCFFFPSRSLSFIYLSIDWLIYWLIDLLIDWFIDCIDLLIVLILLISFLCFCVGVCVTREVISGIFFVYFPLSPQLPASFSLGGLLVFIPPPFTLFCHSWASFVPSSGDGEKSPAQPSPTPLIDPRRKKYLLHQLIKFTQKKCKTTLPNT